MAPKISAILAAGGRGTRFAAPGTDALPKQFIELKGYPIFVWSLEALLSSPAVADAIIVSPPDMVTNVKHHLDRVRHRLHDKSVHVVPGGATRQESVYLGLLSLEERQPDYVLVHDAARPFLTTDILDRFVVQMIEKGACSTAIGVTDTIKRVEGSQVVETIDRESLMLVQTPQGGRFDWLLSAHKQAARDEKATTDDAAILEMSGHQVSIVGGAAYNIKITRQEDLVLADALASILFTDRL
ncbi:MAG TPA: 2-C-methyl-D-erythritol 4-phosphate cytidylyltransferase [Candidatus Obscuribacterales bacterium]